jgi:hypothetical protein
MNNKNSNNLEKDENNQTKTENCINCHFFSKYFFIDIKKDGLEKFEYIVPVNVYDRNETKNKNFDWQFKNLEDKKYKLRCYFRVWDEGLEVFDQNKKNENILEIDRKNKCYFWQYDSRSGFTNIEKKELANVKEYKRKWYRFFSNFVMILAIIYLIINITYMSK